MWLGKPRYVLLLFLRCAKPMHLHTLPRWKTCILRWFYFRPKVENMHLEAVLTFVLVCWTGWHAEPRYVYVFCLLGVPSCCTDTLLRQKDRHLEAFLFSCGEMRDADNRDMFIIVRCTRSLFWKASLTCKTCSLRRSSPPPWKVEWVTRWTKQFLLYVRIREHNVERAQMHEPSS